MNLSARAGIPHTRPTGAPQLRTGALDRLYDILNRRRGEHVTVNADDLFALLRDYAAMCDDEIKSGH